MCFVIVQWNELSHAQCIRDKRMPFPGLAYLVIQSSHVMNLPQANKIASRDATAVRKYVAAPHVMQTNWQLLELHPL